MSYLDRLKAEFPEKPLPSLVSKVPKAPSVTFDTDQGRHVSEIEAAVQAIHPETLDPAPLWCRVSILDPGGRTVEVDTPSGWPLAAWQDYADHWYGFGCTVTPIAGLPKPRAPVLLDEALRTACDGVVGITPAQFQALMSPEDIDDIAAGGIHTKTLKAYALSFAEGRRSGRLVSAVVP